MWSHNWGKRGEGSYRGEDFGREMLWVMQGPGGPASSQQVPTTRDHGMRLSSRELGKDPGMAQEVETHRTHLFHNARMELKITNPATPTNKQTTTVMNCGVPQGEGLKEG